MLVTRTESAIVINEVSSRFFVISPIPFRRLVDRSLIMQKDIHFLQ